MVKKGYKQTDIGIIPENWEVRKLGEVLQNTRLGGNYPNTEEETSYPLIKMGNIGRGNISLSKIEYIPEKYSPSERDILQYGDVLFNTRNTLDLVGKVAIWKNELPLAYYNSNLMKLEFSPAYVSSNLFMNYILNTRLLLTQLRGIATGTTSVAAIYTRDLQNVLIQVPTKTEQAAIATALSDADALISKLEELIAKKRNIKQGAMQELLTGKKRLPGFSGEWEVKRLGEIAYIGRGRVISHREISKSINSQYPVYSSQTANYGIMGYIDTYDFEGEYITWTTDGVNAGTPFYRVGKFNCTNVCGTIKLKNDNPQFLAYLLAREMPKYVSRNLANPKLMNDVAKKIEIKMPRTVEEQTAIAQILSDMDAEIEALEQKLDKYRMIKQGMMQELLTGKTRLI